MGLETHFLILKYINLGTTDPLYYLRFASIILHIKRGGGDKVEKIKTRRKALQLTQQQFAIKIGVSSATVSRWERGKQTPPIKKLKEIAAFFACSADDLI